MIANRDQLKDYCFRRLGKPVIEIVVSEEQADDRIQDALDFWREYHFDAVERTYLTVEVVASKLTFAASVTENFLLGEKITGETSGATAYIHEVVDGTTIKLRRTTGTFLDGETVTGYSTSYSSALAALDAFVLGNWDKGYIELGPGVLGVSRLFSIGPGTAGTNPRNIFDVVYQFRLTDLYDLLSTDLIYYAQVKQHLQMLDMLLPGERSLRFNRRSNRLFIDMPWHEVVTPGEFIMVEAFVVLDPDEYPSIYDDIFLKRYATALIKRQWAENMGAKYTGIKLLGGVTIDGKTMYNEAILEIEKLEAEMQTRWEEPPFFMIG